MDHVVSVLALLTGAFAGVPITASSTVPGSLGVGIDVLDPLKL
jgi:hypothetical protein